MFIEDYVKTDDGLSLFYRLYNNDNDKIIFLHGLAMDSSSWHYQVEFFKKKYSLLLFDQRGHGKSSKPKAKNYYTLEKLVQDVETVSDKLDFKTFNLIGFSMGGSVAIKFAQQFPDRVKKVVTINAPYNIDCVRKSFFYKLKIASIIPKKLLSLGLNNEPVWLYKNRIETHRKCFSQNQKWVIENIVNNLKDYKNYSLELKTKHLFIYSSKDEIVKPKPPLGSNYKIIENGHHYVIAQKPFIINDLIMDFI